MLHPLNKNAPSSSTKMLHLLQQKCTIFFNKNAPSSSTNMLPPPSFDQKGEPAASKSPSYKSFQKRFISKI